MSLRPSDRPALALQATYGGYPCRIQRLGLESAVIDQTLHLPVGHRAHLSFRAAGEWFHMAADVERSGFDRELSMDAGHPIYRTDLSLQNVASEVGLSLGQLLHVLALDVPDDTAHTEATQFEIVGC